VFGQLSKLSDKKTWLRTPAIAGPAFPAPAFGSRKARHHLRARGQSYTDKFVFSCFDLWRIKSLRELYKQPLSTFQNWWPSSDLFRGRSTLALQSAV